MEYSIINSRQVVFISVVMSLILLFIFLQPFLPHKTRVVICDVGQGDGIYIRTEENIDIVIDAGPGQAMKECLGRYMPLLDNKIEAAFLTNSDKDHYGGFAPILKRYKISLFIATGAGKTSTIFKELETDLKKAGSTIRSSFRGDTVSLGQKAHVMFLWPEKGYLYGATRHNNQAQSPISARLSTDSPNVLSQVFIYREGSFDILFTGDAEQAAFTSLIKDPIVNKLVSVDGKQNHHICSGAICKISRSQVDILKMPHHGSKNGITRDFYTLADPMLSVISAGRNNRYKHPSKEIVDMLEASKIPFLLTARDGDIIIEHDEATMHIKTSGPVSFPVPKADEYHN